MSNINEAATSWTEPTLPIDVQLRADLDEMMNRQLEATPSAADLARARGVIIGAEYDAHAMNVQFARSDERTPEARTADRARTSVLEDDQESDLGALARELRAAHCDAIDATDNLARLAFLVAFLARRAGIDLDAALREFDQAAHLVATYGEGADYVPAGRGDQ